MPAKIKLRRSTVAGRVPAALDSGQLAINEADGKLFWRGADGAVRSIDLTLAAVLTAIAAKADSAAMTTALAGKLNASAYTAADVRAKLLTVDGSGSGLDADVIRGTVPSAFGLARLADADAAAARSGLGLGTAATMHVGVGPGVVAAGDDSRITGAVQRNGDETIGGVKTFSAIPVGPAADPTAANQLARKAYVDAAVAAVPPGQPIPTSSADYRVGTLLIASPYGGSSAVNDGSSVAGSSLRILALESPEGTLVASISLPGTWRNVSGKSLVSGSYHYGYFVRIA